MDESMTASTKTSPKIQLLLLAGSFILISLGLVLAIALHQIGSSTKASLDVTERIIKTREMKQIDQSAGLVQSGLLARFHSVFSLPELMNALFQVSQTHDEALQNIVIKDGIRSILLARPELTDFFVWDPQAGKQIYFENSTANALDEPAANRVAIVTKDLRYLQPLLECATQQQALCLGEFSVDNTPKLIIAYPIVTAQGSIAIYGAKLPLSIVNTWLADLARDNVNSATRLVLINSNELIVTDNLGNSQVGLSLTQVYPEMARRLNAGGGDRDVIFKVLPIRLENLHWNLILEIPANELYEHVNSVAQSILTGEAQAKFHLLAVAALIILFSMLFGLRFVRNRENLLQQSETQLQSVFDSSPIPLLVAEKVQDNYRVLQSNQAWASKFGFDLSKVIGRNEAELALWVNNEDRQHVMKQLLENEDVSQFFAWLKDANACEFQASISCKVMFIHSRQWVVFAYEDTTESYRLHQQSKHMNQLLEDKVAARTQDLEASNQKLSSTLQTLEQAQRELIQAEKLASLGELVAGIAHELNTPVGNAVMAASTFRSDLHSFNKDLAQGGLKKSALMTFLEDSGHAANIILRNLERASSLVTSFKQVAADQTSSQKRTFAIKEVVDEVLVMLHPTLKRASHEIEVTLHTEATLESYPGPLGQVLINLIQNAVIHAFEEGQAGKISLTIDSATASTLVLRVKDNGRGMTPEVQKRVYDPFYTTRLGAGGTGLGLNLVHNLVTGTLKGKIDLVSAPGEGSEFIVTIPCQL